ncbi:MAG TPA: hypothetical protein VK172_10485 [Lentimicrobium sp.]|nr:hypothetical protein [Lentimicrobium sp.]
MTKKEFKEYISVHHYGRQRATATLAIFYDWKTNDKGNGYKYCIYARACNATQKELFDLLYAFVRDNEIELPYYINIVMAETDELRFKVPLDSGGLHSMLTERVKMLRLERLKAEAKI